MKRNLISCPLLILGLCFVASPASSEIVGSQRTVLGDDIVHYTFDLVMGPGEFDIVRLHRVVRERRPGHPVATVDGVFLLPGAPNSFEMIFMAPQVSTVPPWDRSIPVFLAQNDIDVWGIDYAWALVPPNTTDFSFMEGWGLQRDIDFAQQALTEARAIRVATGQGKRRLHLLGFSYGVPIAYAIAGEETLLPPGRRQVKGLIPVDYDFKTDDDAELDAACDAADSWQAVIDGGQHQDDLGFFLNLFGLFAESDPGGQSPFFPLLTNWQFALFVGADGVWHFVGGEFDPYPFPVDLRFTEADLFVDVLQVVPPYTPVLPLVDINATQCDEVDVPFDDHLGEIALPILYVGAAGGEGPHHYTASLTATGDFEWFNVQRLPDEQQPYDFGHADLFTAEFAKDWVWQPILDWLVAHRENRTFP